MIRLFFIKSKLKNKNLINNNDDKILEKYKNEEKRLKADVLKIAHHGSKTSSTEEFIKKGFYMSGTKGMLPTVFDVEPVSKADRIHQAEKPVELLEKIIGFITLPNEKILDQYMGSGVTGEAALKMKRDSVLIEKNKETFDKAVERVNKRRGR